MVKPLVFEKPLGVRDYLPDEVRWKKEVEKRINGQMEAWGYQELITPALEYYDTVGDSTINLEQRLYKLIDRDGKTLVLRPDMTAPIARVVASLLQDEKLPLRLSYNAPIYRMQDQEAGKNAEFFQSGVELIGASEPYADAEIIALAAEALMAAGLEKFKIAIGETAFLQAFLEENAPGHVDELKAILIKQDYVGWQSYIRDLDISPEAKEKLFSLPKLQGSPDLISEAKDLVCQSQAQTALSHLEEVLAILDQYGLLSYIHLDFTMLRGHDYYTGMIFEVYAPPVGFPICGGGRYNDLLAEFGRQAPAVGFGIWQERLIEALDRTELVADTYLLLFARDREDELESAIRFARKWRKSGHKLAMIGLVQDDIARELKEYEDSGKYIEVLDYMAWTKYESEGK